MMPVVFVRVCGIRWRTALGERIDVNRIALSTSSWAASRTSRTSCRNHSTKKRKEKSR